MGFLLDTYKVNPLLEAEEDKEKEKEEDESKEENIEDKKNEEDQKENTDENKEDSTEEENKDDDPSDTEEDVDSSEPDDDNSTTEEQTDAEKIIDKEKKAKLIDNYKYLLNISKDLHKTLLSVNYAEFSDKEKQIISKFISFIDKSIERLEYVMIYKIKKYTYTKLLHIYIQQHTIVDKVKESISVFVEKK
jgi:cobalamin biosynthesis protein CobT